MIAGVAGGIAQRLGVNATLVRLAWVLSVLFGGFGILAYLVLWVVLPKGTAQISRPELLKSATRAARSPTRKSSNAVAVRTGSPRRAGDDSR